MPNELPQPPTNDPQKYVVVEMEGQFDVEEAAKLKAHLEAPPGHGGADPAREIPGMLRQPTRTYHVIAAIGLALGFVFAAGYNLVTP